MRPGALGLSNLTLWGPRRGGERSDRSRAGLEAVAGGDHTVPRITGVLGRHRPGSRRMDRLGEFGVASHAVAVAADVDGVTAVEEPVGQLRRP